jgi:hypothetical protein
MRLHCPRCQHEVAVMPQGGQCPSCKVGFIIDADAPPIAPVVAPASSSLLFKVVVGLLAVGLALAGWRFGGLAVDRLKHPSDPVLGDFGNERLGLSVSLPMGWRHLRQQDEHQVMGPSQIVPGGALTEEQQAAIGTVTLDGATFFRGRLSSSPDAMCVVGRLVMGSSELRGELEKNFVQAADAGARNMVGVLTRSAGMQVTMSDCEPSSVPRAGGASCAGTATAGGETFGVQVYIWPYEDGVAMVIHVARADDESAVDEAREIAASVTRFR